MAAGYCSLGLLIALTLLSNVGSQTVLYPVQMI